MIVRPLASSEIAALIALARRTYADAFGADMAPDDLRFVIEEKLSRADFARAVEADLFLVAEQDGDLVGFVQLGDRHGDDAGPGDQEIRRLYVVAAWQNRGIGGALMEAALAHPRVASGACVFLSVWEKNRRAQALYRRHGFETVGSFQLMLANGPADDPELIMARRQPARTRRDPAGS